MTLAPETDSRRRSVVPTTPSEELAGLDLNGLRGYRRTLEAEEDRVAYWGRLVTSRIDALEAESGTGHPMSMEQLARVLGETGSGRRRLALVTDRAADPLPDLPILSDLWAIVVDPHDSAGVEAALVQLREADEQLTTYRRALHERIEEATRELILRYRQNPLAALSLIPQD